jgi:hypothetical protein
LLFSFSFAREIVLHIIVLKHKSVILYSHTVCVESVT